MNFYLTTLLNVLLTNSTEQALNAGIDMVLISSTLCTSIFFFWKQVNCSDSGTGLIHVFMLFSMAGYGALQLHGLPGCRQAADS